MSREGKAVWSHRQQSRIICMDNDSRDRSESAAGSARRPGASCLPGPTLPRSARLSINRCNLPAVILGSLTYQRHPVPLEIDGIRAFHADLFGLLAPITDRRERAERFIDYMAAHFCLDHLEEAGLTPGRRSKKRVNANYLRLVRGWSFDSDGREGAVLKHWVETRFGLLTRHHGGPLDGRDSEGYHAYMDQAAAGLYATNALESQLDLLYTYCQYELARQHPGEGHLTLYRGINHIDEHEVLGRDRTGPSVCSTTSRASPPAASAPTSSATIWRPGSPSRRSSSSTGCCPGCSRERTSSW